MLQRRHITSLSLAGLVALSAGCDRPKLAETKKELRASDLPGVAPKENREEPQAQTLDGHDPADMFTDEGASKHTSSGLGMCWGFLKTIPQEAFFYHVKAKLADYVPQAERGLYLQPHFRFHGLMAKNETNTEALNTCANAIAGIENIHQLKHLQQLAEADALAYLTERLELAPVIQQRFPVRTCALFIDSIRSRSRFKAVKEKLSTGLAEVEMELFLSRLNTAGPNLQGRDVTARSCLQVVKQFKTYNHLLKFNQASNAEQFELLALYALPVTVAH